MRIAAENAQMVIAAAFERTLPEKAAEGARLDGAVMPPRRAVHGDLAANHALVNAAALGLPPAALARLLVRNIDLNGGCFAGVTAAESGFLNFTFGDAWYNAALDEAARFGAPPPALSQPETAREVLLLFPHTAYVPEQELAQRGDMENPIYRVRYAYARIGAVVENCALSALPAYPAEAADTPHLALPAERALIKLIAALPGECARAEERGDAASLCAYALHLADGFYALYAVPRYFNAGEQTLAQRLLLLAAARRTLGYALDSAGVCKRSRHLTG